MNVIQRATTLAFVPVIYAFSFVLRRKWGISITLLLRIVAGEISMIITLVCYVCQRGKQTVVYTSQRRRVLKQTDLESSPSGI